MKIIRNITPKPHKQNHPNRPKMAELNAARIEAGQIRHGLVHPRIRTQMILRLLSAFGISTSELLISNGAAKSDLAELTRADVIQTNRIRFRTDPRAAGQMMTIVELAARGKRLAKASGAAAEFRPAIARYHQAAHDLLVQSLAMEVSRILGPIPGRIRSILSSDAISNRSPGDRRKMFNGAVANYLPDAVVSTRAGQIFFEFERSPKTKQVELYRFTRKLIYLGSTGRVVVAFPSIERAQKFHKELLEIESAGWMRRSYIYNQSVRKWFENSTHAIEIGVNDWPGILGTPRLVDLESGYPETPFWADFRRARNGIFVVGNFSQVGQKIPFLSVSEWIRLGRPM